SRGDARDAFRAAARVRADAQDRVHLQAPAVHGAPAGGAAQPRVPVPGAAAGVPGDGAAALAGAGSGRAAQHVHVDRGPDLVLDAAVPAADAEARLRTGLDHDLPEVFGARVLLRDPAEPRRRVR